MAVLKYKDPQTGEWVAVGYGSGGGGGLLPQIIVSSAPGATVTCEKDGVVLTAPEVNGTWKINVTDYGEWTVTVSLGGASNSAVVNVTAVCQMPITILTEFATIFVTGLDESSEVRADLAVPNPEWVVPSGYTQLEYIQSTGTQYINTLVTGGKNASFEMTARLVSANSKNNNQFFGMTSNLCSVNGQDNWFRVEKTTASGGFIVFTENAKSKWTLKVESDGKVYLDNALVGTLSSIAGLGWGNNANWIFQTADNGTAYATNAELYALKMWTDGVLVRDFIPVKRNSDGALGLYDLANDVFYTNAGSGTFIAGDEVPQFLGYVEGKTVNGVWSTKTVREHQALIPTMTSNVAPSGIASTSGKVSGESEAFYAFDGNSATYSYGGVGSLPWFTQYEFEEEKIIDSFSYRIDTGTSGQCNSTHEVQISTDGTTWEKIWSGSLSGANAASDAGTITLDEAKTVKYIKWVTTSKTNAASEALYEFQVYGEVEVEVGGFAIKPITDYGTWTVTATNGAKTATQDVLVEEAVEYGVEMTLE